MNELQRICIIYGLTLNKVMEDLEKLVEHYPPQEAFDMLEEYYKDEYGERRED